MVSRRPVLYSVLAVAVVAALVGGEVRAQPSTAPQLRAGELAGAIHVDGRLDEAAWQSAEASDAFRQTDPLEGAAPSVRTTVRVLAGASALIIGIECEDDPSSIVSRSVARDADLDSEDHIRVVFGPSRDGRSGYAFSVNPGGARHDALIAGSDDENGDWDGIWEAATAHGANGWSAELRIPIQTLSFNSALREWDFNVERRLEGRLETARWAFPARQYRVIQTSRAGLLTELPAFDTGIGLTIRPAVATGAGVPAPHATIDGEFQPSLDVTQRVGGNIVVSATTNTDFAETEVDTRRTNLTRFPLLFPEKRTFFLAGSDIFGFGIGLNDDVLPYFSRRIGLVNGREVPIIAGVKINGRAGDTNFGGLVVGTNDEEDVVADEATMMVARVKQNLLEESSVGAIVTAGDPLSRSGSWLAGGDVTLATSRFRGDKNVLVGVWGIATGRDDIDGDDRSAFGFKVDYPNDEWDLQITGKRIGHDFDPSIGFVPRRSVYLLDSSIENETRLARGPFREVGFELRPFLASDLSGAWESYEIVAGPIDWQLRSGDRVEFNINPAGERLVEGFEVADGVVIESGRYHWRRYRLSLSSAERRRAFAEASWETGGFYDGELEQLEIEATWHAHPLVTFEVSGERNAGRLAAGRFTQTLVGTRARLNLSPDLSVASYVQFDTESDLLGTNTRLRWTLRPQADLFVVYNHNIRALENRWQNDSNQLLVKLQYAFRY